MNPQKDDLNGRGLMAIVKDLLQLPECKGAVNLEKRIADKKLARQTGGWPFFMKQRTRFLFFYVGTVLSFIPFFILDGMGGGNQRLNIIQVQEDLMCFRDAEVILQEVLQSYHVVRSSLPGDLFGDEIEDLLFFHFPLLCTQKP